MAIKIGIMGFGRIGRNIFRILHGQNQIEVVAIADIVEPEALSYLLKFDTVFGRFPDPVITKGDAMYIRGREIKIIQAKEPKDADWKSLGVDYVVEATAKYKTRASLEGHLAAGAKKVILTRPCDFSEVDYTLIRGVNDDGLRAEHRLVGAGSITTNCISPIIKILDEAFGIENAYMNTIHAYTNAQRLADVPHNELRMSRAAAENMIPAESKVPLSVVHLFPHLKGKVEALAVNVPVPDGSCVDLVCNVKRDVTVESVNAVVRSAAESSQYKGLIEYTDEPIVSSDVVGNPHSAMFDGLATQVVEKRLLKSLTWFDNGWGYAHRVVEIIHNFQSFQEAQ